MIVNFGKYHIEKRIRNDQSYIYDIVRNKWYIETKEEQVRQLWIHYLIYNLNISSGRIAVERGVKVQEKTKRFDICVYDKSAQPFILLECKSPNINLTDSTLGQLSRYNLALECPYLIITNGLSHKGYHIQKENIFVLENIQVLNICN